MVIKKHGFSVLMREIFLVVARVKVGVPAPLVGTKVVFSGV